MNGSQRKSWVSSLVLVAVALLWIFPVYWMVNSALQTRENVLTLTPHFVPAPPNWGNFRAILHSASFWRSLRMSLGVACLVVVVACLVALLTAVALSRFRFRGRRFMVILILAVQMIPAEAMFISQYRMLDKWHLLNSVGGLTILYVGGAIPFTSWVMRGFVDGVPVDLEEAAQVDGCSRLGAFRSVTLPLLWPGLVSTGVFTFLQAWNEYTVALITITSDTRKTLPLWLQSFQQGADRGTDWGMVMAGATLMSLPVMLLFILVQNKMSQGLVSGAVKG